MRALGKVEKITLRDVWPNEATEFTPWLAGHVEELNEAIGLDIEVEDAEVDIGDFRADIVGVDGNTNQKVIIENQLEDSNHDHLGKIITCAAGRDARFVIWIVKRARPEHRAAIEWLNNNTIADIGFFLLEIELWKIGDSLPAPRFNVIEAPNDWTKKARSASEGPPSEAENARLKFWEEFNKYASQRAEFTREFNLQKPSRNHWHTLRVGTSKCHISLQYLFQRNKIGVEFYVKEDKSLFDTFYEHRREIEEIVGAPLEWNRLSEKKACRILLYREYDLADASLQSDEFDWLVKNAIKFKKAFRRYL